MPDESPLERAHRLAREAARDMKPTATEVDHVIDGLYNLDGIIVEEEGYDVVNATIMYDDATNQYALLDETRQHLEEQRALARAAERVTATVALLQEIELKVMMPFDICDDENEMAAVWAAIDSTASQSTRLRIKKIGGDVDSARRSLDRFS